MNFKGQSNKETLNAYENSIEPLLPMTGQSDRRDQAEFLCYQ